MEDINNDMAEKIKCNKIKHVQILEEHLNLVNDSNIDVDKLDCISIAEMTDTGLFSCVRGAKIISDDLWYLDKEKTKPRITSNHLIDSNSDSSDVYYGILDYDPDNAYKYNVIFYINEGEKLSNLLTQLPHGLVDKKATGIGATTLEIKSKRNSIIVVPTRKLARQKVDKENKEQGKEACLYFGSKETISTTEEELNDYLDNAEIEYKKILVVADSLWRVIKYIKKRIGENVYRDYFLMVDEIDTLQSDGYYRESLENVIDYYLKFKIQRRCMVSATVSGFSNPALKTEQEKCLTTIQYYEDIPQKEIKIIHTYNIHMAVRQEITKILSATPDDKILIAYNSITSINEVIKCLEEKTQENCGILCSPTSKDDAGNYYTEITEHDTLERQIVFMTCAYFAGIDIADKCHLITVSDTAFSYTVLPINRITQIHGRCRNGILSDTIIHNSKDYDMMRFNNIEEYKKHLFYKADMVIEFLEAAKPIKERDKFLKDFFAKIEDNVIEKATEILYDNKKDTYTLTRKNAIDKNDIQRAYFNIDTLCERVIAYSTLYSHKKGLYDELVKLYGDDKVEFEDRYLEILEDQKENRKKIKEDRKQKLTDKLKEVKNELLGANESGELEKILKQKIRNSKRNELEFYRSIQKFYLYIDFEPLIDILIDACLDKRTHRNMNNAIAFWILDDNHFFKADILRTFKVNEKYSSETINKELETIFKHNCIKPIGAATEFLNCCLKTKHLKYEYIILETNPKDLPTPQKYILKDDDTDLNKLFIFINKE